MGEGLCDGGIFSRSSHMDCTAIGQNRFNKDAAEGDIVCFGVIGQSSSIITGIHKYAVGSGNRFHGGRGGLAQILSASRRPRGTERRQENINRGNHDLHVIVGEHSAVVEAVNDLGHLIGVEIKYQLKGGCR